MGQNGQFMKHYLLYALGNFIYGISSGGIGPYIPYLSQSSGIKQTEYSGIFLSRGIGIVAGTVVFNYLDKAKVLNYHQLITCSCLGILIANCFFSISMLLFVQTLAIFLNGAFNGIILTVLNISTVKLSNQENIQSLFLIMAGTYSVGGLIAPLIIYICQLNTFIAIGITTMFSGFPFLALKSAQLIQKQVQASNNQKYKFISDKAAYMLYLIMFAHIGVIAVICSWISSYSVLQQINTKQQGIVYASIFFGATAISRFGALFIPGSSRYKLYICIYSTFVCLLLSFVVELLGYTYFSLMLEAILIGLLVSPIFSMVYSIGKEQKFQLRQSQVVLLVVSEPVGEGLLPMICGRLMDINLEMYFVFAIILAFILILCIRRLETQLDKQKDGNLIQLINIEK